MTDIELYRHLLNGVIIIAAAMMFFYIGRMYEQQTKNL